MNIFNASVRLPHRDYVTALPKWVQVEDCYQGEQAIKSRKSTDCETWIYGQKSSLTGTAYLPMPNACDQSPENLTRYNQYKFRAMYLNTVARTVNAMVGAIFRKEPVIELPSSIAYMADDCDGNGLGLTEQAIQQTSEVTKKGRAGLLVDFPMTERAVSVAEQETLGVRAYIAAYKAEDIINWRTVRMGAVNKLCLIVLREEVETLENFYQCEYKYQYRVLFLDEQGVYNVAVVAEDGSGNEVFQPRDGNGQLLNYIPFTFIGSENNDYTVDEPPVYDLATTNLKHYLNSADVEESSFFHSQSSFFAMTDMSPDEIAMANPNGIQIGARSANVLSETSKVQLLQADPNSLSRELMKDKEQELMMLGARLIMPSSQETAEAARIKHGADSSQLGLIVKNVQAAYLKCLEWAQLFNTGSTQNVIFELNDDFFFTQMTAQERAAWVADIQMGYVATSDYRAALRDSGILSEHRSDEEIEEEINETNPLMAIDGQADQ